MIGISHTLRCRYEMVICCERYLRVPVLCCGLWLALVSCTAAVEDLGIASDVERCEADQLAGKGSSDFIREAAPICSSICEEAASHDAEATWLDGALLPGVCLGIHNLATDILTEG